MMSKLQEMLILLLVTWVVLLVRFVQGQSTIEIDTIVAQDGTGNYNKIMDAVEAAPEFSARRYNIKIKEGNYTEYVVVPANKPNLTFVGDGIDRTIISGNRSYEGGEQTYNTATVGILGAGFMAIDITFENNAGASKKQAVATRSDVESAFYRCKFLGYQDTLCPLNGKQFYRECQIYGTLDFIFGYANVVFQNCDIYARLPPLDQSNFITITAQGREDLSKSSGIVIHNCSILPTGDFLKSHSTIQSFLGRPWRKYSRTIIMQSYIDSFIDPLGWTEWDQMTTDMDTVFYAEYQNRGPGAATDNRVKWKGFHILNTNEALNFTVRNFISGNEWIPSMGVPFFPDLMCNI